MSKVYLHIVFLTKNRAPFLADRALRREMHAYLAGACRHLGSPSLRVGGVEDHVHISCFMSRTRTMADFVGEIKRQSSKWIKTKSKSLADFRWQNGYDRRETFKDEFRRLLQKYEVDYDERYLWD